MKLVTKIFLVVSTTLAAISLLIYIPIWNDDNTAGQKKQRIHELIRVGQDLTEATDILKKAGFSFLYPEPITPTFDRSYLQQLVIVGETQPNFFETASYVLNAPLPFTHSESPYVRINAALDGKITDIK